MKMDEIGEHYTKQIKPNTERKMFVFSHMWDQYLKRKKDMHVKGKGLLIQGPMTWEGTGNSHGTQTTFPTYLKMS
jgi:hypothetical protein